MTIFILILFTEDVNNSLYCDITRTDTGFLFYRLIECGGFENKNCMTNPLLLSFVIIGVL